MIGALIAVSGSGADDFATVVIFGGGGGGLGDAGEAARGLIEDMLETLDLVGLSVFIFHLLPLLLSDLFQRLFLFLLLFLFKLFAMFITTDAATIFANISMSVAGSHCACK